ncbi:MAG: CARDB domain-containing protein [Nanoarchaeota archaeon]
MSKQKKHWVKQLDPEHMMVLILLVIILIALVVPFDGSMNLGGKAGKKPVIPLSASLYLYAANWANAYNFYAGYPMKVLACIHNGASIDMKAGQGYLLTLVNSPDIYGINTVDIFADGVPIPTSGDKCVPFVVRPKAEPGNYLMGWALTKDGAFVPGNSEGKAQASLQVILYAPPPFETPSIGGTDQGDFDCGGTHVYKLTAPPGSFIAGNYEPLKAQPFAKDKKLVMAIFHYDPKMIPDATSVAWFEKQVKDMVSAGVDVILPVYRGFPSALHADNAWANQGIMNLVSALQKVRGTGVSVPKIGLFFDTKIFASNPYGVIEIPGCTGVQNAGMNKYVWGIYRDFWSMVPPDLRAQLQLSTGTANILVVSPKKNAQGKPLVLPTAGVFGPMFFGGEGDYDFVDTDWALAPNQFNGELTTYGAALNGPQFTTTVAQLGPGFDNSNSKGAAPMLKDRENGAFYVGAWAALLADPNVRNRVILETWNNDYEGSELDETAEYGRKFITLTRAFVDKWKGAKDDAVITAKIPGTMNVGSSYTLMITVQNSGTTSWSKELGYKLAVLESNWGVSRVDLDYSESIAPGSSKTFTFSVVAPSTAGKYPLTVQMVQELGSYKVSFGKVPSTGKKEKLVDASTTVTVKALPPQKCKKDADCPGQKCVDKVCVSVSILTAAPSCADGIKNGLESDVDCGQPCFLCADGKMCTIVGDCKSNSCVNGKCQAASCVPNCESKLCGDGNGCGGFCTVQTCPGDQVCVNGNCAAGSSTAVCGNGQCESSESCSSCSSDCGSCGSVCGNSQCESSETCSSCSADCGACSPQVVCGNGKCESGETSQSCPKDCVTTPTVSCTDGVKNQGESDVDCGGPCPACVNTKKCVKSKDCKSGNCISGVCKSNCAVSFGGKCPNERGGTKQCGSSAHQLAGSDCYWCCVPN